MIDLHEEQPEPFRVTPGFIAFVAAMCLPLLIAVAIYAGAALVASDVYAVEDAEAAQEPAQTVSGWGDAGDDAKQVDGWKKSLVGICPLH